MVQSMIEEADRRGLFDLGAVERLCDRDPRPRGTALLASILTDFKPEPITRSEAERVLLEIWRGTGLPLPETNAIVEGYEVDAVWRDARVVVEVDSRAFHLNPTAFEEDRLRDARLQLAGYRVLRITWRRLMDDPAGVVAQIRALLGW